MSTLTIHYQWEDEMKRTGHLPLIANQFVHACTHIHITIGANPRVRTWGSDPQISGLGVVRSP